MMQPQSSMRSSTTSHERESNDGASDGSNSTTRREDSISTSTNGSSSHKKRKKNATMACNTCRRKRNRCIVDEGASVCRGCKASGSECAFAQFDKRRDGIQELREKLSFYESMFETLQNGSNSQRNTLHHASSAASAAVDQSMQDHQQHLESFDFLSNSNNTNSNAFSGSSSSSNALGNANNASTSAFFDQANNGTSDASAVLTRTPQSTIASRQLHESPREEINGTATAGSSSRAAANNGDAYEGSAHSHNQSIGSHPSAHRRVSARTPDMLAVMDHLAVESNGLIRAYGATSETALAGFEDLPNQKTVYNTRRYHSALNSREPPREVTPPADVQPLQSSALAAAANNITALPLGTDIRTVQHLLHLYFLWAWPMFPVISRQIFMQHFTNGGQYYSPLLLNVSLAFRAFSQDID
jgi:hypothetical protein